MKHVCCYLFLLLSINCYGLSTDSLKRPDVIEAGMFFHSVSLPFTASNGLVAFNRTPGVRIGVGYILRENRKKISTQYTISLAGYHQKGLHYGYKLVNLYQVHYIPSKRLWLKGGLGTGYLHTFEDAALYQRVNSSYEQIRDWGRSQITLDGFIGTIIPVSVRSQITWNYTFSMQLPFARKGGVSFVPHSHINFGIRLKLFDK